MAAAKQKNVYNTCLAVSRIKLSVLLGFTKKERNKPQDIEVDMRLFFPALPSVGHNDEDDFLCYDDLSCAIRDLCKKKEYKTIEYLGHEIYLAIRPLIPKENKIVVKLIKCNPPIDFVMGGASFTYTDLPPSSWVVPHW